MKEMPFELRLEEVLVLAHERSSIPDRRNSREKLGSGLGCFCGAVSLEPAALGRGQAFMQLCS